VGFVSSHVYDRCLTQWQASGTRNASGEHYSLVRICWYLHSSLQKLCSYTVRRHHVPNCHVGVPVSAVEFPLTDAGDRVSQSVWIIL
jgi:hypothetical protein